VTRSQPTGPLAGAGFVLLVLAWAGVCTGAGSPAAAAEPEILTLDEAIEIALAGNPVLAAEDAAARAAEQTARESRAARWPTVRVTTDATRTTNPVAVFGQLLTQEEFGQENFAVDSLNNPDPLTNVRGVLSVSQPLWAGGRIDAGIEGAERRAEAALSGRERARQELVYRVTDRYTGAVVTGQAVAVRREGLEVARESVKLTRDLYEAGLVVESDLLQAQVRESEAEAALADAEKNAGVARAALNLELGRPLDTPMALPPRVEPMEPAAPADAPLEALLAEAAEQRPDLRAARARVEAARAGLRRARGDRLPEIGWSGAFEADSEEPFDDPGSNWTVGVGLRWTAFDGFATGARVERARAELERAERLAEQAARGVALEVESALEELQTARLRWQEARRAVELAERSAAIVRDRYQEGLTTVVELLQAQTLTTGSRVRELAARRDLVLARAGLALAAGRAPAAPGEAGEEGGDR
jgi:outer membrane protein TolC